MQASSPGDGTVAAGAIKADADDGGRMDNVGETNLASGITALAGGVATTGVEPATPGGAANPPVINADIMGAKQEGGYGGA